MISRRSLLKAIGLAPAVPAMAALATKAEAADISAYAWGAEWGTVPTELVTIRGVDIYNPANLDDSAMVGPKGVGLPNALQAYADEIVDHEPLRYAPIIFPFSHPEL